MKDGQRAMSRKRAMARRLRPHRFAIRGRPGPDRAGAQASPMQNDDGLARRRRIDGAIFRRAATDPLTIRINLDPVTTGPQRASVTRPDSIPSRRASAVRSEPS